MATSKIAITIEENILNRLDFLVNSHAFPNRSRVIQKAVAEKLNRIEKKRLARECAKLDPKFEQAIADEGFAKALIPKGIQGKTLLRFEGAIPAEDLQLMSKAIEEGCEKVDADEW